MKRIRTKLVALSLVCAAVTYGHAGDIQYTATDLGLLTGPNSYATGVNDLGQVVGYADTSTGYAHAFLYTASGPLVNLGSFAGDCSVSQANSINDSSTIVGESNDEAYVFTPQGGMQAVGFLSGGTSSELYSINNAGVAVGGSTTLGESGAKAVIWDSVSGLRSLNDMIVNPPINWTPTAATAISQNGLIAGIGYANTTTSPPSGTEYAFTLDGGTMTVIPSLGIGVYPEAINESGEVVGLSFNASRSENAFVYTPAGGIEDIGSFGGTLAIALGVNDQGVAVGASELGDGSFAAFLYTDAGGMVNLNTLVQLDGWTLAGAEAIADNGDIAATGYNGQVYNAFLLTPTPEPSTFPLLVVFAGSFLILRLCNLRPARTWTFGAARSLLSLCAVLQNEQ